MIILKEYSICQFLIIIRWQKARLGKLDPYRRTLHSDFLFSNVQMSLCYSVDYQQIPNSGRALDEPNNYMYVIWLKDHFGTGVAV